MATECKADIFISAKNKKKREHKGKGNDIQALWEMLKRQQIV